MQKIIENIDEGIRLGKEAAYLKSLNTDDRKIENTKKCLNDIFVLVPSENKSMIQLAIKVINGDLDYDQFCKLNE